VDGVLILLLACAAESYDDADLQVDIQAAVPDDAEQSRLCVEGVGLREEGAGNGRLAFPGLPQDLQAALTVDMLDQDGGVLGRSEPLVLSAAIPYQRVGFSPASGAPCEAAGDVAAARTDGLLLVVRFIESGWEQD
jgi:hypothetical protein